MKAVKFLLALPMIHQSTLATDMYNSCKHPADCELYGSSQGATRTGDELRAEEALFVTPFDCSNMLSCFGASASLHPSLDPIALPQHIVAAIKEKVVEHQVLVFRKLGQNLSLADHVQWSQQFGPIDSEVSRPPRYVDAGVHVSSIHDGKGSSQNVTQAAIVEARKSQLDNGEPPEVFKVVTRENDTLSFGEGWHTDLTFLQQPPDFATVIMRQASTPGTGETGYLNALDLFSSLPDSIKKRLWGCWARHSDNAGRFAWHPSVRVTNGRPALFVNRHFTKTISCKRDGGSVGFDSYEEDPDLLEYLYDHLIARADNASLTLAWENGDLGMWDERTTQHAAVHDYIGQARELHRVLISPLPGSPFSSGLARPVDAKPPRVSRWIPSMVTFEELVHRVGDQATTST